MVSLFCGVASGEDVLIGNLPGDDGARSSSLQNGRIKAMGFAMSGEDAVLHSVRLRLDIAGGDAEPLVRLFGDDGGAPGEVLLTLQSPTIIDFGAGDHVFTSNQRFVFRADRTYWLVVYNTGGSDLSWLGSDPGVTPSGDATHAGSLFSLDAGPNPPLFASTILNSYEVLVCGRNPRPDLNADGVIDADDFFLFLEYFAAGDPRADFNDDGEIDANDFFIFLNKFALGC